MKDIFVIDALRARLLLVLCCMVCYINTLPNNFALDDDFAYTANQYVQKGAAGIPDILTHPYYTDATLSFDYRPVAGITFAIEKELFGNNPLVGHFINVLLYIIAVLLVLQLLTVALELPLVLAFIIALIYAVHPAHVEVVASIKNREELFSFIFAVISFLFFNRLFTINDTGKRIINLLPAIIFMLLSFTSKLTSLPMVPVMLAFVFFKKYEGRKSFFYVAIAIIGLVAAGYFSIIYKMVNRPIYDLENPLVAVKDIAIMMGTSAHTILFYFKFMFVPYPLSFFYGYNTIPITQLSEPTAILSILLHAAIFIYGAVLLLRKEMTGFMIIAYFIAISVYSNMIMLYTGIVSERALFFASLWFIGAACCFVYYELLGQRKNNNAFKIAITGVAVLLIIYGGLTINRNTQWRNTMALMSNDVKHLENSTLANYFYGCVLKIKGEEGRDTTIQNKYLEESKKYLWHTCALSPVYPYGYFRLGLIYRYNRYTPDSVLYFFKTAYQLNPALNDVAYQYGRAEYEFGDIKIANDVFANLYQKIPGDTFTVFYHAMLLMKTGHLEEGHTVNAAFMNMAPAYYQAYYNEGIYYELAGGSAAAVKNYEASLQLGCTDPLVYNYLGNYYEQHGNTEGVNRMRKLLQ